VLEKWKAYSEVDTRLGRVGNAVVGLIFTNKEVSEQTSEVMKSLKENKAYPEAILSRYRELSGLKEEQRDRKRGRKPKRPRDARLAELLSELQVKS